jgi:hypothetical protein
MKGGKNLKTGQSKEFLEQVNPQSPQPDSPEATMMKQAKEEVLLP